MEKVQRNKYGKRDKSVHRNGQDRAGIFLRPCGRISTFGKIADQRKQYGHYFAAPYGENGVDSVLLRQAGNQGRILHVLYRHTSYVEPAGVHLPIGA